MLPYLPYGCSDCRLQTNERYTYWNRGSVTLVPETGSTKHPRAVLFIMANSKLARVAREEVPGLCCRRRPGSPQLRLKQRQLRLGVEAQDHA
jgi:hypothetical protein